MTHFLYSPNRHFQLTELEGNPDVIEERGQYYKKVAVQLKEVSVELDALAKKDKYRSEALDDIRESSGVLAADLDKVEDRYAAAGPVLEAYAKALRRAQNTTVDPLVPQIQTAHASAADADAAQRAAQRELDGLEHVWPWEDQPTSTEMRTARNTLSTASTAAVNAAASLNELWVSFESGYSSWESSYETAVNGLQRANDASGVNDEWWEDALDFIATAAGIIAAVVVIVALFVAAPIAAVLLVIATVASIIALVATIGLAIANPRKANGWDIALAAIGVVPFLGAFAKGLKGGVKPMESLTRASGFRTTTRSALEQGRNTVFLDLRSIKGMGGEYGGQAARLTRAATLADDFMSNVFRSRFSNYWNAIRSGGARDDGIALTMSQHMTSRWPGGASGNRVTNWVAGVEQPGWAMSAVNTFDFVTGSIEAGSDVNSTIRSGSLW